MQSLQDPCIYYNHTIIEGSCKEIYSFKDSCKIFASNALLAKILYKCLLSKVLARLCQGIQENCIILQDIERFFQDLERLLQDPCKESIFFSTRICSSFPLMHLPSFSFPPSLFLGFCEKFCKK